MTEPADKMVGVFEEDSAGPAEPRPDEIVVEDEGLKKLATLANRQMDIEDDIAVKTTELEKLQKDLRKVSEVDIPLCMEELELESFVLKSGAKVGIKKIVRASIPKAKQTEAFQWLKNHRAGSLIKNQVVVSFGMNQDSLANKFLRDLGRRKVHIPFEQKKTVHGNSLTAYVKEQLEAGKEIPLELLGVFQGKVTQITRPVKG